MEQSEHKLLYELTPHQLGGCALVTLLIGVGVKFGLIYFKALTISSPKSLATAGPEAVIIFPSFSTPLPV